MHNLPPVQRSIENKSNLWLMMNGAGAGAGVVGAAVNNNGQHDFNGGCVGVAGERTLPQPSHVPH